MMSSPNDDTCWYLEEDCPLCGEGKVTTNGRRQWCSSSYCDWHAEGALNTDSESNDNGDDND